jgi:hypothetical protein
MAPPLGLLLFGKLGVVAATTLAGARLRLLDKAQPTCGAAAPLGHECQALDAHVSREVFYAPWVLTAVLLLVLSLPTVALESRHPVLGLQWVTGVFLHQTLMLILCAGLPRTVGYALGLHACVHTLLTIRWGHHLVGGRLWWGLRFPAAAGLVGLAACYGPPVSVLRWPGADSTDAVACATSAHLVGGLLPDLVYALETGLIAVGAWLVLPCE